MKLPADHQSECESLKYRLQELTQNRSVDELLQYVVKGTLNRPHTALTQILLLDACDQHEACPRRRRRVAGAQTHHAHFPDQKARIATPGLSRRLSVYEISQLGDEIPQIANPHTQAGGRIISNTP